MSIFSLNFLNSIYCLDLVLPVKGSVLLIFKNSYRYFRSPIFRQIRSVTHI